MARAINATNVAEWALGRFATQYGKPAQITKDDIFHSGCGVRHDPVYRTTYAQNFSRDLPRVAPHLDFRFKMNNP